MKYFQRGNIWWGRWSDSNGRPNAYEALALPAELQRQHTFSTGETYACSMMK